SELGAEPDAMDFQFLLKSLCDAFNCVRNQASSQSMERLLFLGFRRSDSRQLPVIQLESDPGRNAINHRPLRTLHLDQIITHFDFYPGWNRYDFSSNSRHVNFLLT